MSELLTKEGLILIEIMTDNGELSYSLFKEEIEDTLIKKIARAIRNIIDSFVSKE